MRKYWMQISIGVLTTLISGILLTAWLSFLELKQLVWQAPLVMNEITTIKTDMQSMKKDIDRIERSVRIEKQSDKVVKLIERD